MATPSSEQDIIAAIATPAGVHSRAAIGIVRTSGHGCLDLIRPQFRSLAPGFSKFVNYRMHHGQFLDLEGQVVDEVLVVFFPGPGSYTGEDMVEIHCHGGPAILEAVLECLLVQGARTAEPGEFTKRAFLNGKLDLTQAEAVAEAIAAPARPGLAMAQEKLAGRLGQTVRRLSAKLKNLRAALCVAVDFPEEEMECLSRDELSSQVMGILADIKALIQGAERGRRFRDGALVVLAGPVNAGKSSLFNALLGNERAIVSSKAGTTRDFLEETLILQGLPIRITDTAGLRKARLEAEKMGLARTRQLWDEADLALLVLDATLPLPESALKLAMNLGPERVLVLANKLDLLSGPEQALQSVASLVQKGFTALAVSAITVQGLEELLEVIRSRLTLNPCLPDRGILSPNLRQAACLAAATSELEELLEDSNRLVPYDLLAVRLETACSRLDEITGEITSQDILEKIFQEFCIGK